MGLMDRQIAVFELRTIWIEAYVAWYAHFLAMQPKDDRIAEHWVPSMVENTLIHFHERKDQAIIKESAIQSLKNASTTAIPEKRVASTIKPAPAGAPLQNKSTQPDTIKSPASKNMDEPFTLVG